MSKAAKAGSGSKSSPPVEVTPMPDISALSPAQQKKFLNEWLSIQKTRAITDNLEKIMDAVSMTALFAGQYGIYQHGIEDKMMPAAVAGTITSLVYMLKDNHSTWATGIVLAPLMTKIGWDVMMKFPSKVEGEQPWWWWGEGTPTPPEDDRPWWWWGP